MSAAACQPADGSGKERRRGAYGKLYCREYPELSIAIYRNGPRRFCIARAGGLDRKTGDRRKIEVLAEARLGELHQEAGFGKLDRKFGIMRSFPTEKVSAGGARKYTGQSPFSEFGEVINPWALDQEFAMFPLWLFRAPIAPLWKLVYSFMVNDARATGLFGNRKAGGYIEQGPEYIAQGVNSSRSAVQCAIEGLIEYRLTSPSLKRKGFATVYQFHRHPWMLTSPHRGLVAVTELAPTSPLCDREKPAVRAGGSPSHGLQEEEKNQKKSVVVVPPVSEAHTQDDNENDLSGASIQELETMAKQAGANIKKEKQKWRKRSDEKGWSEDEAGWKRWLVNLIKRKPMRKPTAALTPSPFTALATSVSDEERARIAAGFAQFRSQMKA